SLLPCGNAVGIHVDTDGLLVLGTGAVTGKDGLEYEPAYRIVNSGDYIRGVDGKRVNTIKQLQKEIQKCENDSVVIDICRNDIDSSISLPIVEGADGVNRIGVWVREDTQGIGTLTYIAPDGSFGALGHGITDIDTGVLMKLKEGSIYNTEIIQIIKGGKGNPGEIMGMILESSAQKIGDITSNTDLGIGGVVDEGYDTSHNKYGYIPIALRQEVEKGPAVILSQLGDEIEEYDIEIIEVKKGSSDNKGMVIKITDEQLIEKAGGIIQGMSGSPIIQNGKIVGAVTHVFVDDPGKGYGIFIENMLEH
ncbi:MAG: SpoIVB peptidase, partial [Lachnospiraceae bacterium]|nr:SpoIVB peptidase [Lachnospiraceae bacterium]